MRAIFYSVIEKDTKARVSVGVNHAKAQSKLAELKASNPNGNYVIGYKWGSI